MEDDGWNRNGNGMEGMKKNGMDGIFYKRMKKPQTNDSAKNTNQSLCLNFIWLHK